MDSKKRLRWKCRRGLLELDIMFTNYLNGRYCEADKDEQQAFESLLENNDQDLFTWMTGKAEPKDIKTQTIVSKVRKYGKFQA